MNDLANFQQIKELENAIDSLNIGPSKYVKLPESILRNS
jgi:hypothetical protein